jgi:electron transfer flavoprotein alpha subunit
MVALVIAEHDNGSLKGATHHTVTAAAQCGGEVHILREANFYRNGERTSTRATIRG